VQFHFLQPHDVEKAMYRLAEAGLTSREACGSAVRNITGCPYAGVAADEVFERCPPPREVSLSLACPTPRVRGGRADPDD
jgi:sulfite reductase beta subunit-like hemoprotein